MGGAVLPWFAAGRGPPAAPGRNGHSYFGICIRSCRVILFMEGVDMMVKEQLEAAILQILDKLSGYQRQPDRTFLYEIFADYRDVMAAREAIEILQSDDPLCTLYDRLNEWYLDCQLCLSDELEGDVQEKLAALYPDGFTDEDEDEIHEILTEKVCFELPVKHFMS